MFLPLPVKSDVSGAISLKTISLVSIINNLIFSFMTKVNKKKSNKVGKVNKNGSPSRAEAKLLLEKGETFGDSIICMMSLIATDYKGMGVAAVGLARAFAFLKYLAESGDGYVEELFMNELENYEKEFGNNLEEGEK